MADEFTRALRQECNTLLRLLLPRCTDGVQAVDSRYGRRAEVQYSYGNICLQEWLPNGDKFNVEKWESKHADRIRS